MARHLGGAAEATYASRDSIAQPHFAPNWAKWGHAPARRTDVWAHGVGAGAALKRLLAVGGVRANNNAASVEAALELVRSWF